MDIVGRLAIPAIESIFLDLWKPGPFGVVLQMADPEVLFDDVSDLGDFFVSFDFQSGQFRRGRILSHDAIGDLVEGQKVPVRLAGVSLVREHLFDGLFGMAAISCTIRQIVGVVDRFLVFLPFKGNIGF